MSFFKRPIFHASLGLGVLNLLLFGDLLGTPGKALSSQGADLNLHFASWRQFGFDELQKGHLVLWNPHHLCGNPFLGNFESALLYPPNWLYLVLPLVAAINWGIILHVYVAGFFTYLWARYRKLSPLAAFLSGVIYMWGGAYFLHLYAGHLPNLCAMVWAPLIFLAIDGVIDLGSISWILLGAFSVSMQILAGHPQYVYFTGLVALLYLLVRLSGSVRPWRSFGSFSLFYVGALLLTAAQSWTGFGALLNSARHVALDPKAAGSFSFPPQNLLTSFMPDFFGRLQNGSYWSSWYFWEGSLFIGFTSLVLAVIGLFEGSQRRLWLGMLLLTLILAFGAYTPLYPVLYHWLPFFSGMRGMGKFVFLTSLFLSILAGMGLDQWSSRPRHHDRAIGAVLVAGIVLLVLGRFVFGSTLDGAQGLWSKTFVQLPWLAASIQGMTDPFRQSYIADCGVQAAWSLVKAGGTALVLAGLLLWGKTRSQAFYGVVLLAVLELFLFARAYRPVFDIDSFRSKQAQLDQFFLQHPGDYRVYGVGALAMNTPGADIWEDEPIVPRRYAEFVGYTQGIPQDRFFSTSPVFSKFKKTYGLIRLKYILSEGNNGFSAMELAFKDMPRMALVSRWTLQNDATAELKRVNEDRFDPAQEVVLETDPGLSISKVANQGKLRWMDHSTDEIEIEADTTQPCVLLVTDNYDPGWKAEALEGSGQKDYRVLPGDYFLRAIPLQPGYHHLILRYRPWGFEVGKWVSLLSCFAYVAILLAVRRRNKNMGPAFTA